MPLNQNFFTNPPTPSSATNKPSTADRFLSIGIVCGILWYLVMCVVHLLSSRPLWNDESCVFQSVRAFHSADFFKEPLQALQVFPRVYLFLIQKFSQPFSFDLISLRAPSFVCMVLAFCLWLRIASYELKSKLSYLTFVLCWSASVPLIYYSAELKQYSMDVLSGACFIWFLYNQEYLEKNHRQRYILLLILLPLFIFFSYPTYFFVLFPLYHLILACRKDKTKIALIVLYTSVLAIYGILSYLFDMRLRPEAILLREWHDYFISFQSVPEFFKTLGEGTLNLFTRWFVERPKVVKKFGLFFVMLGVLRMFGGFFVHIKKDRFQLKTLHTIPLIIFLELLFMGAVQKYPFTVPRTSLFFCPLVLFLTIQGIYALKRIHRTLYPIVHAAFLYFLVFVSIGISFYVLAKTFGAQTALW